MEIQNDGSFKRERLKQIGWVSGIRMKIQNRHVKLDMSNSKSMVHSLPLSHSPAGNTIQTRTGQPTRMQGRVDVVLVGVQQQATHGVGVHGMHRLQNRRVPVLGAWGRHRRLYGDGGWWRIPYLQGRQFCDGFDGFDGFGGGFSYF